MTTDKIILDYAVDPVCRPLSKSITGQKIISLIDEAAHNIDSVMKTMFALDWPKKLSKTVVENSIDPYWINGWFPPIDGLSLSAILKQHNPATFLEIGSGNSTKFARKAISEHNLRTKIISIDPHPRTEIDKICDEVIRSNLENADLSVFNNLASGDVVFMDSSHRSFMNTDVTVFFLEILPQLPQGLIYGLHDILLPNDYPNEWGNRFYNEQYLLATYLIGGADDDTIIFPARYVTENMPYRQRLLEFGNQIGLPTFPDDGAGGFWMQRGARQVSRKRRLFNTFRQIG